MVEKVSRQGNWKKEAENTTIFKTVAFKLPAARQADCMHPLWEKGG